MSRLSGASPEGAPRVYKLLYQCPGCWNYDEIQWLSPLRGTVECRCGERMTLIDLRARREQSLTEDAH